MGVQPEPVWEFNSGGYQVCEKWLKDRKGRTLSETDIAERDWRGHRRTRGMAECVHARREHGSCVKKLFVSATSFAGHVPSPSRNVIGLDDSAGALCAPAGDASLRRPTTPHAGSR